MRVARPLKGLPAAPIWEREMGGQDEKRNGLAVLMAGCSRCGCAAPSPFEMQREGWEIVYDEQGLVSITCPAHLAPEEGTDELPDYLIRPDETR
jgi:hypothetical protein